MQFSHQLSADLEGTRSESWNRWTSSSLVGFVLFHIAAGDLLLSTQKVAQAGVWC